MKTVLRGRSHTIFVTHALLHTISFIHTLLHTIFHTHSLSHTQSCHTPSFSRCGTWRQFCVAGHTHLCYTGPWLWFIHTLLHTIFHTHVTLSHGNLCVAGVAQSCHIHHRFAWQAWHLETSAVALRGRRGNCGTGLALQPVLVALTARHFAWQASHLVTSAASFCVAGVALVAHGHIHLRFAWQAWHMVTSTVALRGRRGT